MANYSSIAIGVNRYQFVQPLSYAQADAQAIHSFLIEEAELPPDQALLLTDASPWLDNQSTYPTRESILRWLQPPAQPVARPFLWFFFSGYATHEEGRDYLLPIDANPADAPNTGIAAQHLFDLLAQQGAEQVVLFLDINRSPNLSAGANVGAEIVQMAQDQGFICVLSCQLEETSHESMALGHGMFTVALLEVLRYYRHELTLDRLARYLCDRLPELSQHHWRPVQNPLILMPSLDLVERSLLPVAIATRGEETAVIDTSSTAAVPRGTPEPALASSKGSTTALEDPGNGHSSTPPQLPTFGTPAETPEAPVNGLDDIREDIAPPTIPAGPPPGNRPAWSRWLLWGSAALVIALLASWLWSRRQPAVVETPPSPVAESPLTEAVPPAGSESPAPALEPEAPAGAAVGGATPLAPATTVPEEPAPAEPAPEAPVPPTAQPPAATLAPASSPQTEGESRAILARARTFIQANQASGFGYAIAEARKIPPGAPLHEEAQADIQRWSQVILDIAKGRVARGQFDSAIAAAKLVSPDQGATYQEAQQSIQRWQAQAQQQQRNHQVIAEARKVIDYTQASSYNRGIAMLAAIPPGQPGYFEAQTLQEQWSQQIYLIANSRAAQGNLSQAVATAQLVPVNTPIHPRAQEAIARWQQQKP